MQLSIEDTLAIVKDFLQELLALGKDIFSTRIRYDEQNDHLGAMTLFFSSKQIVHAKSLLLLCKEEQFSDATILCRVMLEGMAALLWASHKPQQRPLDWRMYSLVSDLRRWTKLKQLGKDVPLEYGPHLIQRLEAGGKRLFTPKARKASEMGRAIPDDPYVTDWLLDADGKKLNKSAIFSEIDAPELYGQYSVLCDWIHWNPQGFGFKFHREGDSLVFNPNPLEEGRQALAGGFQSLLHCLELLDNHHNLGYGEKLKALKEGYIRDLNLSGEIT